MMICSTSWAVWLEHLQYATIHVPEGATCVHYFDDLKIYIVQSLHILSKELTSTNAPCDDQTKKKQLCVTITNENLRLKRGK